MSGGWRISDQQECGKGYQTLFENSKDDDIMVSIMSETIDEAWEKLESHLK